VKEQISTQRKELKAQLEELELHLRDLRAREKELSLVDEAMTDSVTTPVITPSDGASESDTARVRVQFATSGYYSFA
jgi:phage shock protein A